MSDERDTDTMEISGFDDTASIVLEVALDDTLDLADHDPTDRVAIPRARTQPHWPPAPPPPSSSRRHKAVYMAVGRARTSSDAV